MTQESLQSTSNATSVPVQASSMAIVSMVSGIACWFVLPLIGALIAVITGHMAKKEIRESGGRLSGVEMANAGLALGYVHLAISFLAVCLVALIVAGLIAFAFSSSSWGHGYIRIGL